MKRAIKIICFTLLGLVVAVLLTLQVVLWAIATPEQLTPAVRKVADQLLACEYRLDEVDLTLWSSLPDLSLRVRGLCIINPTPGSQNDTLLSAPEVRLSVDVQQFLRERSLRVHEISVEDAQAHLYLGADGTTNLQHLLRDTTSSEDTTSTELPLSLLDVERVTILARQLSLQDERDSIYWSGNAEVSTRLNGSLDDMHFELSDAFVRAGDWRIDLEGWATLGDTISTDVQLETNDLDLKPILAMLPPSLQRTLKPFRVEGLAQLKAHVAGQYADSLMPVVDATLLLRNGKAAYTALPYTLGDVQIEADAHIDMQQPGGSNAVIRRLHATTRQSRADITGRVDDLLGDMQLDCTADVQVNLPDVAYFLPDSMTVNGRTEGQIHIVTPVTDLMSRARAEIDMRLPSLDVQMSDITASLSDIALRGSVQLTQSMPVVDAQIDCSSLEAQYDDIHALLQRSHIQAGLDEVKRGKQKRKAMHLLAEVTTDGLQAEMNDSLRARTAKTHLRAEATYNEKGQNLLLQWNPKVDLQLENGHVEMAGLDVPVEIPHIDLQYSNKQCDIRQSEMLLGRSQLGLKGQVRNIGKWLRNKDVLEGELDLSSNYIDGDQLLSLLSAKDTTATEETATKETVEETAVASTEDKASSPFLVPEQVDLMLHTHVNRIDIFDQTATQLKGGFFVRDGKVILDEVGFVCRAAKLQLTAMYRSPRPNHLYVGLDYHMLDVDIDELLKMIPQLRAEFPMLEAFRGQAEFHIAAETYLNQNYEPKTSTLRGACSLVGKDLVVLDNSTFSTISKLLLFNKKTENKIDSLNAEITLYKKDIDVYPLCVQMDNYMVALGGRHRLDMTFDYDINVLKPIYLGVHVGGNLDDLDIKLAPCKFAKDFRPHWHGKVDEESLRMRQLILESMRRNVEFESKSSEYE